MDLRHSLPSLTAGAHDADSGEACVMEYVSVLAGEPWSDRPECTHPILAHEARTANDLLDDADRPRLVPLVGRFFGTADDSAELRSHLRLTQARQVLRLVAAGDRAPALTVAERAEAALRRPAALDETAEVAEALTLAHALPVRTGDLDLPHAQHHVGASRVMAFSLDPEMGAAEAWSLAALVAAHRLAAGECRADCGSERSRALRMVRDLGELLDTYDAITERESAPVPDGAARRLAAAL